MCRAQSSDSWQRSEAAESKGGKSSMSLKKLQSDLDAVDFQKCQTALRVFGTSYLAWLSRLTEVCKMFCQFCLGFSFYFGGEVP